MVGLGALFLETRNFKDSDIIKVFSEISRLSQSLYICAGDIANSHSLQSHLSEAIDIRDSLISTIEKRYPTEIATPLEINSLEDDGLQEQLSYILSDYQKINQQLQQLDDAMIVEKISRIETQVIYLFRGLVKFIDDNQLRSYLSGFTASIQINIDKLKTYS